MSHNIVSYSIFMRYKIISKVFIIKENASYMNKENGLTKASLSEKKLYSLHSKLNITFCSASYFVLFNGEV